MSVNQDDLTTTTDQATQSLSVFEATMKFSVDVLTQLNGCSARPGEEGVTSAFMGCILSNFPWCVLAYGPHDVPGKLCEWAQYSKGGKGQDSESRKGADFALLVKMGSGNARLAIFQAKSDKAKNIPLGKIKLHHPLKGTRPNGVMRTQMVALFDHGVHILNRMKNPFAGVIDMTFVHYLAQIETGVHCVQLSQLPNELKHELETPGGDNLYEVPQDAVTLLEVLLDVTRPQPRYWTEVSVDVANSVLPKTIELMDVFVGDDGRGGVIAAVNAEKTILTQIQAPDAPIPAITDQATARARNTYGGGRFRN